MATAGATLVLGTTLLAGSDSGAAGLVFVMSFGLWALLPYVLLLIAGRFVSNLWVVGGAGVLALAAECGIRAAVFLFPRGSTAALALIVSPAWIAAIALPAGAGAGYVLGRVWRTRRPIARGMAAALGVATLALVVLGLARPDLFPTAVLKRRQILERLGLPRVVRGAEGFETLLLSERAAWHVSAELDGRPGDEIAIVDHEGAEILGSLAFERQARVALGGQGRLWNWFSTLARVDGSLVVVQTGGGYSETELRQLDGGRLWSYRPNPELAPSALRPADLDADGSVEFYASWDRALVRLDTKGREVWSRPTRVASLVALAPRTPDSPAWVVAHEYGRRLGVWDEAGRPLAEIPVTQRELPLGIGDFPRERGLLLGGPALRVVGLDGRPKFERAIEEDLTLVQALSLRARGVEAPLLAALATAPRDVGRARLFIIDAAGEVRYDEILAAAPRLLKAARQDGTECLLLSGNGLRVLRPRAASARR